MESVNNSRYRQFSIFKRLHQTCKTFVTCLKCHVIYDILYAQGQSTQVKAKGRHVPHDWTLFIDQMVVLASDDKQNAINVSGNESKLENVYMGIKIVKNVFWTFVKFYILSINPSKWTFSTSAIENTILWSCKGSKKSDLYFLYIKYFTVSCGIYSLLKFAYFTHGWFRPKLIDQKLLPTMKAILIQSDVYEL